MTAEVQWLREGVTALFERNRVRELRTWGGQEVDGGLPRSGPRAA